MSSSVEEPNTSLPQAGRKLNASLLRLKLLDSLRSNDQQKISTLFEESGESLNSKDAQVENVLRLTLHYAVQVGPLGIVQYIVNNQYVDDINTQDGDGNTPLHLAVNSSRYEIVSYLMGLPAINDCISNAQGKQAIELTDDLAIIQLISDMRTNFVEMKSNELRKAFESRDFNSLSVLLSNPRVVELLDINGTDPITGDGVLHEFVKRDDLAMCKFILEHGGDPFKRNTLGKLPIDLANSSQMKKLLKESSKEQSIIDPMGNGSNPTDQAPTFKGFLKKWTNFAGGYKLRWFVLDADGRLSYYKSPNDMNKNCRGAINLSNARLKMDSSEKSKFEIEIPSGSGTSIRWHLKSNHYIEANRWVWFLQNAIRYNKDLQRQHQMAQRSVSGGNNASKQTARNRESFDSARTNNTLNVNQNLKTHQRGLSTGSAVSMSSFSDTDSDIDIIKKSSKVKRLKNKLTPGSSGSAPNTATAASAPSGASFSDANSESDFQKQPLEGIDENDRLKVERHRPTASGASSIVSSSRFSNSPASRSERGTDALDVADESDADDDEESQTVDQETGDIIEKKSGPYGSKIIVLQNNLNIEISSLKEFLDNSNATSVEEFQGVCHTTLSHVERLLDELKQIMDTRDEKIAKKFSRQKEISTLWENSIKTLEFEMREREQKIVELEDKQLHLTKILKKKFGTGSSTPSLGAVTDSQLEGGVSRKLSTVDPKDVEIVKFIEEHDEESDEEFFDAEGDDDDDFAASTLVKSPSTTSEQKGSDNYAHGVDDSQSEKTVPFSEEKSKSEALESKENAAQSEKNKLIEHVEESYKGYEEPVRTKLGMDEDNRPKLSLWSVLKSMVGQDMTKITLPVSFNEPTSLLQRVAEDMEYTSLLDTAAAQTDSTLRMVYVAAFAASEYASTINRIAKPFNPLLGETYEYARPDRNFRFMVEQVSHHPPIGAAMAESKYWDYYGESNVKSKFTGRSFDIKPLGTWFLNLRPNAGSLDPRTKRVTDEELYTWKKVTSSVVGIIIGSPTVDNYGNMEIHNHNTGDRVLLQFKARGWRESSAYEVKGTVYNGKNHPKYHVFGHWNSKIFARAVGPEEKKTGDKFLIWQANERPKIPFNLTAFATSLNAPQKKLMGWLPRTDTRLRPDQRAMEEGRYDDAAKDKLRVEDKQRAAKKKRDAKGEIYTPKWFVQKRHPVTGEEYWQFKGDYWQKRAKKDLADAPDIF